MARAVAVAAMAAACSGCGPAAIYPAAPGPGYLGQGLPPRGLWRASGTMGNPQAVLDNRLHTVAAGHYAAPLELTIDLTAPRVIQLVVLDHGWAEAGHSQFVSISTSVDGLQFTDRYAGAGSRRVTTLLLPEPVLARYIRLRPTGSHGEPWTIAELYLQ